MLQVHTVEEIPDLREVNNEMASQSKVQANTDNMDLTPLVDEYLTTARALRSWRFILRASKLESL